MRHFEELWESCETLHENLKQDSSASIIDEIIMKLNLYKMVESKSEVLEGETKEAKDRIMGEILLAFTKLSMKDNINVFAVLSMAEQYRKAESLNKIPPDLRLPQKK